MDMFIGNRKAFFRFEASEQIGAGHAMRSCVIADELMEHGWECQIVTSAQTYDFIKALDRFKRINPDQFETSPVLCDLLVVDNYDLDYKYEQKFRPFAKKIMVIDDLANRRHECDVLLNYNFGYDEEDYKQKTPQGCSLFIGPKFILVSKEYRYKEYSRNQQSVPPKVLLYLGGVGIINSYEDEIIKLSEHFNISYICGFLNKKINENVLSVLNRVYDSNSVKCAYAENDICIGFAGQGMFERFVYGLPSVVYSQNEIQHNILNRINKLPGVHYAGNINNFTVQNVKDIILDMLRQKMTAPTNYINEIFDDLI